MQELNSQFQAKAAMVASLGAQYLQRQQNFSRQQKIKTVDGIQAKQDISAAYLEKLREKVEFYGNRYYPDAAKVQRLAGEVRLMVILNKSGGIRAIRLIESSGHSLLDEAARTSVRKAAPFGGFDKGMKDISELRIVRTWRFYPAEAEFEVHSIVNGIDLLFKVWQVFILHYVFKVMLRQSAPFDAHPAMSI